MSLVWTILESLLGALLIILSFVADEARPGLLARRDTPAHAPYLWERGAFFLLGAVFAADGLRRFLH
jgi:hypothetical protein